MINRSGLAVLVVGLLWGAYPLNASAEVALPGIFADHMVLQRDCELPIWGTAAAGEEVEVSVAGQTQQTKADDKGNWQVKLKALKAGGPHVLRVQGKNAVEIKDVLVGEVWLCSGQSNMAWTVSRSANPKEEIASAKYPQIRMFKVPRKNAATPQTTVAGAWSVCSPKTVGGFSATAYFFGRELFKDLKVPVGLINSSVGGTPIEAWTSRAAQQKMAQIPAVQQEVKRAGISLPGKNAGGLYNAMIAPLAPYAIQGAIWYQGEANRRTVPLLYRYQLPAMIANWRADWKQPDFPFLFVQLPNFTKPQTAPVQTDGWVLVREGMFKTLSVPNTGMAVTTDVGEAGNIHPRNKQDVGKRLSLWALAKTYGKDIVYSGPIFKKMRREGNKIVLEFDSIGSGMVAKGGKALQGFAIAGADKSFVNAEARIVGKTIEVSSPKVASPMAVRYAWAANPKCNLYNKEGLPASPFRTDDWAK